MNLDTLWRAMLYSMHNSADCGLKVDGGSGRDKSGNMHLTMRPLEPGSTTVSDKQPVR